MGYILFGYVDSSILAMSPPFLLLTRSSLNRIQLSLRGFKQINWLPLFDFPPSLGQFCLTVSKFFKNIYGIYCQFSCYYNQPISNNDLVTFMLKGLGPDYLMFVTDVLIFSPLPEFPNLRSRILNFET
ncbi:hypothetical protein DVH24_008139 [Malus domestica]|uniref:Uncharacterized protein n=1 Tax=Malus domestica TaxID=3750 RepID=A0A498JID6_MALDO|nr:hypothetical protein DVH24_008139 [Malus domestica]